VPQSCGEVAVLLAMQTCSCKAGASSSRKASAALDASSSNRNKADPIRAGQVCRATGSVTPANALHAEFAVWSATGNISATAT